MSADHDCTCCGAPVHSSESKCNGCRNGCPPSETWHCDHRAGHDCDGTDCESYGNRLGG